jgi:hypothetical protein
VRPQPKKRRALFNWDGDDVMAMSDAPITGEEFASFTFDPIADSTVDAVLWCSAGGNEAAYRSQVLELQGENFGFEFPDYDGWRRYANAKALIDSGDDQLDIVCVEARNRGIDPFFSLRMNDTHDAWAPKDILPKIKKDHPEWLLGERMGEFQTALNYAQPGLRDLRRRQIVEIFENYDFDGIELDWLRHSMHLELESEYRLRYVLTDFVRDIRATLDEIGENRGKYIEILPRVPETVEACLREGYDVAAWLGEDLVDGLILGQGHCIPTDYASWRQLMTSRRIPLYPCVYGYGGGHTPYPDEMVHAIAASYLDGGADGLYTFNWYPHGEFRKEPLATFGDPIKLVGRTKRYHAAQRHVAIYTRGSNVHAALPVELWPTSRDTGPEIPVYCADDLAAYPPKSLELAVNLHRFGAEDAVEVRINGVALSNPSIEPDDPGAAILGGGTPIWRSAGKVWLKFGLTPRHLTKGVNTVSVILRQRNPNITTQMLLDRVELAVNY